MKDGILIINKPQWYTSFDVVAKIRKILGTKKIGHTGTLDPMATGVLVVCVGKATPLVNDLICDEKVYRTTLKLGIKTDTGDMTGEILNRDIEYSRSGAQCAPQKQHLSDLSKFKFDKNVEYANSFNQTFNYSIDEITNTLHSFIGKRKQIPSIYSSIKVNGKKLYEYARIGEKIDIPERDIEVCDISDISFNGKDEISYTVHCSKGTYIRTLNEDVAKKLGSFGTTMVLQRLRVGKFDFKESVDLEEVTEEKIISVEKLFENKIMIETKDEKKLLNGIDISVNCKDGIYNIYSNEKYIGLGKVKDNRLKRFIIL